MIPLLRPITRYFEDAEAGRLPQVTFVDPRLVAEPRNDDHPLGDPRAGQQFIQGLFSAFVRSPHWERGLFVLVYDEWGGFFDHVAPPHFQDDRANADDLLDFSQAGFRVPAIFASPRVLPGAVDHAAYEHSAVARFLEWRFLGAPPRGSTISARWSLTKRDRFSRNPGELISSQYFDPEVYFNLDMSLDEPSRALRYSGGGACRARARGVGLGGRARKRLLGERRGETAAHEHSALIAGARRPHRELAAGSEPVRMVRAQHRGHGAVPPARFPVRTTIRCSRSRGHRARPPTAGPMWPPHPRPCPSAALDTAW